MQIKLSNLLCLTFCFLALVCCFPDCCRCEETNLSETNLRDEEEDQKENENDFYGGSESGPAPQLVRSSAVESLFGQVAKTVVYGGAALARFNNRILCPLLARETSPEIQDQPTLFLFKNTSRPDLAYKIYSDDEIDAQMLLEANLDANQSTVFFVHGWLGGLQNELWLDEAKNVALGGGGAPENNHENERQVVRFSPNVIVVDWSKFSHGSLYSATKNSHKVSRRLGRLMRRLAEVGGLRPELMHCLGHSIGAHICGRAARLAFPPKRVKFGEAERELGGQLQALKLSDLQRFGRISALDPGGFCYELGIRNESSFLGLRPSDALLVDAYYSNRSPFGNKYLVGQFNVRMNNGFFQKPCSVWRNQTLARDYFRAAVRFALGNVGRNDVLTCDHYFATRFASQQLGNSVGSQCSYVAYACTSYRDFVRGRCGKCESQEECYEMDFEFQRALPSSRHALEHIERHSSLFNEQFEHDSDFADSPPGGVPYPMRRVYYMRAADEEPYCSHLYRVRVGLNPNTVDFRSFDSRSVELKLAGIVTLKDSSNNRLMNGGIPLHGPWPDSGRELNSDLDDRTLTAMFELKRAEKVRAILVSFESRTRNRQRVRYVNPVEWIHIDYLSSTEKSIKSMYSSSFTSEEIAVVYKRTEELVELRAGAANGSAA